MDKMDLMLEADKRGLLPPEKKAMLAEAMKRGLVKRPESAVQASDDPIQTAIDKSPTAGLGDAALALGSGAIAAPVAGIAGALEALRGDPSRGSDANTVAASADRGANTVRRVQDALTYEPRTKIGKALTGAISYPFQKLAEGADAAGGATTDKFGPGAGAAVNTAIQAVPLALGRVAPAGEGAAAIAKRNIQRANNAQVDAGTAAAKDAGYTLPPSQANPSMLNQVLEGIAGKIKTAQTASLKNQSVTNNLIRQGLGVADDVPLTVDTLSGIRKTAGEAYEKVRGAGEVSVDPAYGKALDTLAEPYLRAQKDFPKAAKTEVIDAIEAMRVPKFDAGSAVDQISILRKEADKYYRAGDKNLGGTYKGLANALEDQIGRHLEQAGGAPEALKAFQEARRTIAQTYTLQKHLQPDGNVNAVGLARELKNRPLSGEMKTVAEFGAQFPKAAQMPEKVGGVNAISPLDVGAGGIMATIMHNPGYLALLAGRPVVRSAILSKMYQDNAVNPPSYGSPATARLRALMSDPAVATTEMSQGQRQ